MLQMKTQKGIGLEMAKKWSKKKKRVEAGVREGDGWMDRPGVEEGEFRWQMGAEVAVGPAGQGTPCPSILPVWG